MTDSKHNDPKVDDKDKVPKNVDDVISRLLSNPPATGKSDDDGGNTADPEKK